MALLLATLALGVGGFDPVGFGILLAMGVRRPPARAVWALLVSTCVTIVVLGLGIGAGLSRLLARLRRQVMPGGLRASLHDHPAVWGWPALAVGLLLAAYGVHRLSSRGHERTRPANAQAPGSRTRSVGTLSMVLAGMAAGTTALGDPAFWAMAALAGHVAFPAQVLAMTGWALLSQIPLLAGAIAWSLGLFARLTALVDAVSRRWGRLLHLAAIVGLIAAGAGLAGVGTAVLARLI